MNREVLLIDDDERVREAVSLQLGRPGYAVRVAPDGAQALEALKERTADVVICDIRMPGMSGPDVLKRIHELYPSMPVIMFTGFVEVEQAVDIMKCGAFDYLTKPVRRRELLVAIDKALEWKALIERNARLERENRAYQQDLERKVEERTRETMVLREGLMHAERLSYLGETLASVAHELKAPLQAILGFSELLMESIRDGDTTDVQRGATTIHEQGLRMAGLLEQLGGFSRKPKAERAALDVPEAIEEILSLGEHYLLHRSGVTAVREYQRPLPAVAADRCQLQQVFLNLIRNACQAMPKGGKLTIGAAREGEGGRVRLWFADEGAGIADEDRERIFEPFFTTKPRGIGTGLGLTISRRIIEEHGGSIRIAGRPGEGARFEIELPAEGTGNSTARAPSKDGG